MSMQQSTQPHAPAGAFGVSDTEAILNALPQPVLLVTPRGQISYANQAAESFFQSGAALLLRYPLKEFVPFGSPLLALVEQARLRGAPVNEYQVDLSTPRSSGEQLVDLHVAPVPERPGDVLVMVQPRSMAHKIDRQLTHRGAARTVTSLAAILAHEVKNPLSGIRGAAQLLEGSVQDQDRTLTRLITEETDRICDLVDRMSVFGDDRPVEREPVNIHTVLDRVKGLARNGFASHIAILEDYDPSLPHVLANRDQLIQVFLNLVKNAAEAVGPDAGDGEIVLSTAFRPGVRLSVPGSRERVSLPLEFCVRDNGPGVPGEVIANLFDPFVSTKSSGTGLGLALVAKIVGDHGGVIECDSVPRRTVFRILMPMYASAPAGAAQDKEASDA